MTVRHVSGWLPWEGVLQTVMHSTLTNAYALASAIIVVLLLLLPLQACVLAAARLDAHWQLSGEVQQGLSSAYGERQDPH